MRRHRVSRNNKWRLASLLHELRVSYEFHFLKSRCGSNTIDSMSILAASEQRSSLILMRLQLICSFLALSNLGTYPDPRSHAFKFKDGISRGSHAIRASSTALHELADNLLVRPWTSLSSAKFSDSYWTEDASTDDDMSSTSSSQDRPTMSCSGSGFRDRLFRIIHISVYFNTLHRSVARLDPSTRTDQQSCILIVVIIIRVPQWWWYFLLAQLLHHKHAFDI